MINLSRWKVGLVIAAVLLGTLFALPNFLPASVRDQVKGYMPTQILNLGLDLQGGSYLLLEVDTDALITEKTTNLTEDARMRLNDAKIQFSGLASKGTTVTVRITDPTRVQEAFNLLSRLATPLPKNPSARDIDIQRGNDQTITLSLTQDGIRSVSALAVDTSIETIRRRVDNIGTKEPSIARQGINRITVEAPGESDPEQLKKIIGQTAKLTFQMVDETVSPADLAANRIPPGSEALMDESMGRPLVVRKAVLVSGNSLTKASVGTDQYNRPAIDFAFNGDGATKFGNATARNIGKRFAIILDGRIVSAPTIQGAITGGHGQITGSFTAREASDLVAVLNGGALPAPLKFESQRTVGAELGADAVHKGIISTIIAFITIVVFMLLAYGFVFGGVSIAALLVNLLLIIASMTAFQATLTLPGVAGLILSLAVAVDANVLIYERIRDEERTGHKPIAALDVGFSRALVSILDANITSLIAALIMFVFGAGPVRGFAWTLMIGVFTSVFSAILVSQVLLGWWYRATKPKKLPI
ncbi:protein translocase subunit SecD [Asticcacaulis sp. 201]|uniref:protein translocase subunit SecD n=1 Tax=Asticcacaulis sp. 201 TaxID=3028787 RepID=UPI002916D229|nr:protein translocase subunit SecD [Asticcacaulis sp. 201]MDV6329633.1 protein translocase subunit SecD [Asticcacaulis sp. 201]